MSRFLFVVPPLAGHVNPTVSVGAELGSRGHSVAWCGHASVIAPLLPAGAEVLATDETLPASELDSIVARSHGLRGAEAFRFLWKDFIIPLGEAMLPAVEAAVDYFEADVLIADQQAIAGALVGRRRGARWATSATTSSELADPFAVFPLFGTWIADELLAFQHRAGIPEGDAERGDLRFSEQLVLAFSTEALVGGGPFPAEWRFVGPALGTRPASVDFPWDWLDPQRRQVLITLGTVNAASGERFLSAAVAAAASLAGRVQAIVLAPDGLIESNAPNVLVRHAVPQLELLAFLDAVVCHAGHNTVCETLAHGLPLVVAPIRDDQPIIAQQVVDAGAGVRLKYGRAGSDQIADALMSVLETESYRDAARGIQASFRAAGGPRAAADALESLVPCTTKATRAR
ncbi:MAG: glycosyl transferase [Candidatus Eremiobacteraeota bacterium]|nr:glycosyl transferase [Candidatus Eremiobacteraeota bacterium]